MTLEHKMCIMSSLQGMGEVGTETGDSVNEALALKKMDIGESMGLRSYDVARETAVMFLKKDILPR